MEFLIHCDGSGFGGFGSNFGCVDALHENGTLGGCLCLDSAYQIEVERLYTGDLGSVVCTDFFEHSQRDCMPVLLVLLTCIWRYRARIARYTPRYIWRVLYRGVWGVPRVSLSYIIGDQNPNWSPWFIR